MKNKQNNTDDRILCGFVVLAVLLGIVSYNLQPVSRTEGTLHGAAPEKTEASDMHAAIATDKTSNTALRLQQRLSNGNGKPNLLALEQSLQDRQSILEKSVMVEVRDDAHPEVSPVTWTINFAKHPELLTMRHTWASATFVLNEELLQEYIDDGVIAGTHSRTSIVLQNTETDHNNVERAVNLPIARDGFDYTSDTFTKAVRDAISNGSDTASVSLPYAKASVKVSVDGALKELDVLATGLSDFSNSPEERVWNVHKAIDERVNNIVVQPGKIFSFVDALDVPVTTAKGWKEGMGLFGGGTAFTPGAGICQAATTVYRAALLAGLPITYRRNHSMFVDHYEPYGIGLDATVFPGVHDMTFRNDTSGIILIQAYTIGDEVFVQMYGTDDNREVALDGPYFNITANRPKLIRPLDWDETGWVRTVTYANGKVESKAIVSTYVKGFARSIKDKYAGTLGKKLLEMKEPGATVATLDTSY